VLATKQYVDGLRWEAEGYHVALIRGVGWREIRDGDHLMVGSVI
jgi:hypothetical protein